MKLPEKVPRCATIGCGVAVFASFFLIERIQFFCCAREAPTEDTWAEYEAKTMRGPLAPPTERRAVLTALIEKRDPQSFAAVIHGWCFDCTDKKLRQDVIDKLMAFRLTAESDPSGTLSLLRAKLFYEGRLVERNYRKALADAESAYPRNAQAADLVSAIKLAQMKYREAYYWHLKCQLECRPTMVDPLWLLARLSEAEKSQVSIDDAADSYHSTDMHSTGSTLR